MLRITDNCVVTVPFSIASLRRGSFASIADLSWFFFTSCLSVRLLRRFLVFLGPFSGRSFISWHCRALLIPSRLSVFCNPLASTLFPASSSSRLSFDVRHSASTCNKGFSSPLKAWFVSCRWAGHRPLTRSRALNSSSGFLTWKNVSDTAFLAHNRWVSRRPSSFSSSESACRPWPGFHTVPVHLRHESSKSPSSSSSSSVEPKITPTPFTSAKFSSAQQLSSSRNPLLYPNASVGIGCLGTICIFSGSVLDWQPLIVVFSLSKTKRALSWRVSTLSTGQSLYLSSVSSPWKPRQRESRSLNQ